jgi:hypothetical protein
MPARASRSSGQTLLIAITFAAVLVIGLIVMFYMNQTASFHQASSAQRTEALNIAEDGISYAIQQLSANSTTWHKALQGDFSLAPDCNSGYVKNPNGGQFKLTCSVSSAGNPHLQPYEVAVLSVAIPPTSNAATAPSRAILAYLSQRKLGIDFAAGPHAGAALQMVRIPILSGTLDVQWGPITCLDANGIWTLVDPIDGQRHPRKFSLGGIAGSGASLYPRSGSLGTGPDTDQKEYWATIKGSSFIPLLDESTYIQMARNEPNAIAVNMPSSKKGTLIRSGCVSPNCGYFVADPQNTGDHAIFDGAYTAGSPGAVIYVNGSAEFKNVAIDSATVIVTGGLDLQSNGGGGNDMSLSVPWSTPSEYPYSTTWNCQGHEGGTCLSNSFLAGKIQFRGFLYVKGNLTVNQPGWNMAGVVLVGDMAAPPNSANQLIVQTGGSLTLLYDDAFNHNITIAVAPNAPIKVVPDFIQDVPAP